MLQGERTDTDLVLAVSGGESSAYGELFDRWFNSSWNVARNILRDDDLAADVAQDALLNAWQQLDQLENPDAFGGWLLRITRNRALTRLERERRSRATGDDVVSGLRDAGAPDPTGAEQPLGPDAISEVRDRQELLWAAAGALGEKEASLLDLHLRHGLGPAEIADELGVEANNAHQQLYRLRTKLGDAIGSYLLWRNGRPLCDGLAAAVSGDVAFDKSVARAVTRHQKTCDACAERRTGLVDPSKLFAAVPLVLVPSHLKANAAAALQSAGVPTSSAGSAGSASSGSVSGSAGPGAASGTPGVGSGGATGVGAGTGGSASGSTIFGSAATSSLAGGATAGVLAENAEPTGPPLVTSLVENVSRPKLLLLAGGGVVTALVVGILGFLLLNDADESATAAVVQAGLENLADEESDEGPAGPSGSAGDGEDGTKGDFNPSASESSGEVGGRSSAADNDDAAAPGASNDDQGDGGSNTESPGSDAGDDGETEDPPNSTAPEPTTTTEPEPVTTPPTQPDPVTTPPTDPEPVTTPPTDPEPDPVTTPPTDPEPDPVTTPPTDPEPDPITTPPTEPDPDSTPPPPPPVDPPEIIRFTSRTAPNSSLLCRVRTQVPYEAIWETEGAEKAELTAGGATQTVAASSSFAFCGSRGETIRLVVANAAGEDKATTTLQ